MRAEKLTSEQAVAPDPRAERDQALVHAQRLATDINRELAAVTIGASGAPRSRRTSFQIGVAQPKFRTIDPLWPERRGLMSQEPCHRRQSCAVPEWLPAAGNHPRMGGPSHDAERWFEITDHEPGPAASGDALLELSTRIPEELRSHYWSRPS